MRLYGEKRSVSIKHSLKLAGLSLCKALENALKVPMESARLSYSKTHPIDIDVSIEDPQTVPHSCFVLWAWLPAISVPIHAFSSNSVACPQTSQSESEGPVLFEPGLAKRYIKSKFYQLCKFNLC